MGFAANRCEKLLARTLGCLFSFSFLIFHFKITETFKKLQKQTSQRASEQIPSPTHSQSLFSPSGKLAQRSTAQPAGRKGVLLDGSRLPDEKSTPSVSRPGWNET